MSINPGMQPLDWGIVSGLILFLCLILVYCRRFVRNSADFLAAGRCAGRYVLCISSGVAAFAVVNSVATFEMFYQSGFSSTWWAMLSAPVGLVLSLVAWVTYRFRETRCFTLAQFFEVRYSRRFRIAAGIITWLSGIVNYGIFPAVSVRFFMFFCRLPESFTLWGVEWDLYGILLTMAIGIGALFAMFGGQVAIMVTDFLQGVFCNVAFVVFIFFIFQLGGWDVFGGFVGWEQIKRALLMAPPGESQINPFDCSGIADFNLWYYLIGIFVMVYNRGAWQGAMGYAAAARNPHENRMAGILGTWRGLAQGLMIMLLPLAVVVIMRLPEFSELAGIITDTLDQTSDPQLRKQGLVPTALSLIMPTGMLGLFVAVMFAAMLSTDDTYMHSWGSIFIQDVVMPLRKSGVPLSPRSHLLALRGSILFVAVFAWLFSYFFRQTEYVFMFFAITGAIVSGAGAAIIGGLYWKRGGTLAAWCAYVFGALFALSGIALHQFWRLPGGGGLARWLADNFDWPWVENNMEQFPVNGQWITLVGSLGCLAIYVTVSLYEHYVQKKPDFNLDKMLHRGRYDIAGEHIEQSAASSWARRLGITREFSPGDKMLYAATLLWTCIWLVVFLVVTAVYFFGGSRHSDGTWSPGVSPEGWLRLWHVQIHVTLILGVIVTLWFLIGGVVDVRALFKALRGMRRNDADDGSVVNGGNAGETPPDFVGKAADGKAETPGGGRGSASIPGATAAR